MLVYPEAAQLAHTHMVAGLAYEGITAAMKDKSPRVREKQGV